MTIDVNQLSEYLTIKHIGLLVAVIILLSILFGKKRPKNAPPTAHVGLPIVGINKFQLHTKYCYINTIILKILFYPLSLYFYY